MTVHETHETLLEREAEARRNTGGRVRAPPLTSLETAGLAIAVIMALGPLSAYAAGFGL